MPDHLKAADWAFLGTVLAGFLHWFPAVLACVWGLLKVINEWDEYKKRKQ